MSKNKQNKNLSLRVPELMLESLDARALEEERDRSEIIREAIANYLDLPQLSVEVKLQALEEEQVALRKIIEKLSDRVNHEAQRTDNLESLLQK